MAEKHLKKYSTFLVINANQNNTSYQSEWLRSKTQVTEDAGKDVAKEEHSSKAGGITSWYNNFGNQSGISSEN